MFRLLKSSKKSLTLNYGKTHYYEDVCVCVVLYLYLLNTLSPKGTCVGVNTGLLGKVQEKLLLRVVSASCEVTWKRR